VRASRYKSGGSASGKAAVRPGSTVTFTAAV
jgi:hypothetical protein